MDLFGILIALIFVSCAATPLCLVFWLVCDAVRSATRLVGVCWRCGYDLRGHHSCGTCPECGHPFQINQVGDIISGRNS